jgi:hypothetical protein
LQKDLDGDKDNPNDGGDGDEDGQGPSLRHVVWRPHVSVQTGTRNNHVDVGRL